MRAWSSPTIGVVLAVAIYVVAFLHGRASGPPEHLVRCPSCVDDDSRTITVREGADARGAAECVLKHRPTRGVMHARLARCLGRSSWHPPPKPAGQTSVSDGTVSWDQADPDGTGAKDFYDEFGARGSEAGGLGGAKDEGDGSALGAPEGGVDTGLVKELADEDEDEDEDDQVEGQDGKAGAGQATNQDTLSAEERAARMMDAIREHGETPALAQASSPTSTALDVTATPIADPVAGQTATGQPTVDPKPRLDVTGPVASATLASAAAAAPLTTATVPEGSSAAAPTKTAWAARVESWRTSSSARDAAAAVAKSVASGSDRATTSHAEPPANATAPPKRVITFSLYGKTPKCAHDYLA